MPCAGIPAAGAGLSRPVVAHFGAWAGPGEKFPVPVGAKCADCNLRIQEGDDGLLVRLGDRLVPQHRCHRIDP